MVISTMSTQKTMSISHWSGGNYFGGGNNSWMRSMAGPGDDGVETIVGISGVVNGTDGAVGFHQGILAFDNISITGFVLGFVVTSMWVFYTVFELVFWMCLERKE